MILNLNRISLILTAIVTATSAQALADTYSNTNINNANTFIQTKGVSPDYLAAKATAEQKQQIFLQQATKANDMKTSAEKAQKDYDEAYKAAKSAGQISKGGPLLVFLSHSTELQTLNRQEKALKKQNGAVSVAFGESFQASAKELNLYITLTFQKEYASVSIARAQKDVDGLIDEADDADAKGDSAQAKALRDQAKAINVELVDFSSSLSKDERQKAALSPTISMIIDHSSAAIRQLDTMISTKDKSDAEIDRLNVLKAGLEKQVADLTDTQNKIVAALKVISKNLGIELSAEELTTDAGLEKLGKAVETKVAEAKEQRARADGLQTALENANSSLNSSTSTNAVLQAQLQDAESILAAIKKASTGHFLNTYNVDDMLKVINDRAPNGKIPSPVMPEGTFQFPNIDGPTNNSIQLDNSDKVPPGAARRID